MGSGWRGLFRNFSQLSHMHWDLFEYTVELKAGRGRESKRMIALGRELCCGQRGEHAIPLYPWMEPTVLPPGLNKMYSRLTCTRQRKVHQQIRGKMNVGVQLFTHIVHAVHLQGFQESSRTPNPFRHCLYRSLLWDNPLNGIFKKSDINHQPFNSHIDGCRCLFEWLLPYF